jgi:hypothetical protein
MINNTELKIVLKMKDLLQSIIKTLTAERVIVVLLDVPSFAGSFIVDTEPTNGCIRRSVD